MRSAALLGVGLALLPVPALAHVKWFQDPAAYPLRTDLILSSRTLLLVSSCVIVLALLYSAQRLLGTPHWPELGVFHRMAIGAPTLLAVQAAIGLVHAATTPALLAPQLRLSVDPLGLALAAAQLLIAFSFIIGVLDWASAIGLILLGPVAFALFPAADVLEQLFWAGIGVLILVVGRYSVRGGHARPWFGAASVAWSRRSVTALRVIAGVSILVPALTEKLWNPDLALAFLSERPHFNVFNHFLGWAWLTDDVFVLLAGIVEGVIGVALVSGLLVRIVILAMWLPFNLGIPFLPAAELLGHIPIFGIMYFLLVRGRGEPDEAEQG